MLYQKFWSLSADIHFVWTPINFFFVQAKNQMLFSKQNICEWLLLFFDEIHLNWNSFELAFNFMKIKTLDEQQ